MDSEDLYEVVAQGDRLASLRKARDLLAAEMDRLQRSQSANEAAGRDYALMTKELSRIMAEIDEIGSGVEQDELDELRKRRDERRARA
jgi:hypothetical protein